ncbi:MAG: hypothetical protein IJD99_03770 [Clostridia bacterium]|nr:hypothetical protein [Clostridia bacterium]
MSRMVLAVMSGLLCGLAGVKYAASLRNDALRMKRWCSLLQHLALLLQEGTLSIPEALCTAADGASPADQLLRDTALLVQNRPLLSLEAAFRQCSRNSAESPLLTRMFSRLGKGTRASRILAVEQAAQEMHLLADEASVRADKDAKLWQTLGFAGGACLTIMLL